MQKRAQYEKELGDLPAERAAGQDEQRLSARIAGLGKQLEYKAVDLKATEEKLAKTAAELQTLAQVLDVHRASVEAAQISTRVPHQLNLCCIPCELHLRTQTCHAMPYRLMIGLCAGASAAGTRAGQGGKGGQGAGCSDHCPAGVPSQDRFVCTVPAHDGPCTAPQVLSIADAL